MHRRVLLSIIFLLIFGCACTVPLYKVAPIPKDKPIEAGQTATQNSLEITASAVLDDEVAFERFDANLLLAGILVVDVQLANRATAPTKSLSFEVQDATGKRFSLLSEKKELSRVMKFEGVRLYPVLGKQETLEQLQAITLPKKITLSANEEKRGVLYFHAKQDVAQLKGLVLSVKGTSPMIRIPLN